MLITTALRLLPGMAALLLVMVMTMAGCDKKAGDFNPYSGADPGDGPPRVPVASFQFDSGIDGWAVAERANDARINTEGAIAWEANPFGSGGRLKITCDFDGLPNPGRPTMDGVPLRAVFAEPVAITNQTYIEFDLYYPMNSNGKIMRIELWSSSSGGMGDTGPGGNRTQIYVRPDNLEYLNGPVAGEYGGQAFRVKRITGRSPVSSGYWEDLRLDIHGENATAWENGVLFIGNVSILQQQEGEPIPAAANREYGASVAGIKDKYAGQFLIGTINRGVDELAEKHFNVITPGSSLKAAYVHPNPPQWLLDATGFAFANSEGGIAFAPEYTMDGQGYEFARFRDRGFHAHGHVLAWFHQASPWMLQIVPENTGPAGYAHGNNATPPFFPLNKELARRAYYEHILHELRYFMSRDSIPFISFDVLNEEIHETRHIDIIADIIAAGQSEWKGALRNTSWLMAMTDDDYGDIRQHYVYLLFKFAHIASPNAQMAAKYQEHYDSLPGYMKAEKNIDAFVSGSPTRFFYNDYDLYQLSKAQVVYNMVRDLNLAWHGDPLYDGRNLVEGIGIQGHDTVSPTLASDNQRSIALFARLIDEGLLDAVSVSELDLVQPDSAPGGAANSSNGDILNQKQADAIAYQFALLFKVYAKYSRYIDRITFWGSRDPGWGGSYKPFDAEGMAAPAYYAVIDPDRFIKGHSYLDSYFKGELEKINQP